VSRSFSEPDWIRFFDPKADWRDSLQHFNLHRDYIGGKGRWVLPKWCIKEATDDFPDMGTALGCASRLTESQTQKTAGLIHCICPAV
jgi:hypothetical protein